MVVGIVKPMIMLPPALLCGLDPNQLAAILAHEMAHIRRYDLIVNLLQRIVESLLFFHPVTWWLSRRVSIERENCCDDLAAIGSGRFEYAAAMLRMAEMCIGNDRRRSAALVTLSANGGNSTDFGYRIRRLIGVEETTRVGFTRRSFSIGLALVSLVTVSLFAWGQNQESVNERPEDGAVQKIFTPEPLWQAKLAANDVTSEMFRISPVVVAGNRVLSIEKDFDLQTGQTLSSPLARLPRTYEFGVTLDPVLRRKSSDRDFIVDVSVRMPGNTWSRSSYDLRVLRASDYSQVGPTITTGGTFNGNSCDVDVENGGDFLLVGTGNEVHVYRTETGQIETTMPVKTKHIDAVAISPDRQWLVVSDQNDLHFWRWRDQAPVKTIYAGRKIDSLVFTPDGQYLAEGPDSQLDIQLRDMRTLEVIASLKDEVGSPLMVSSMDITPDGRYLVAHNEVSVDQSKVTIPHRIHVWDLKTRGTPLFQIATGEWVRSVSFSDDGQMIVGEFSGASHGALLAGWQLPNEIIQRQVNPPSDAKDRLGDGIQWSRWGDVNGLLSGARLVLPEGGLTPGQPLVAEYRLANVSTETKTFKCYSNKGMQFTSLDQGNRISRSGLDWQQESVTITIDPGDVFIDTEHLVSINTTGLEPGLYQAALDSAFRYTNSIEPNTIHEIYHRGSIPFAIVGESTAKTIELPKSDIHWGTPIAGLQLGARFVGDPKASPIGATIEADLFVANVTDQPIDCSVVLPHPGDGWRFNVEDTTGSTVMLERQWPRDSFGPQMYVHLKLAPGKIAPITGERVLVSNSSTTSDDTSETTFTQVKFQVVGTKEEAAQLMQDGSDGIQGRLISQGGQYFAIFEVTLLRPENPALQLELDSGNAPFNVLGPKLTAVALVQANSANSPQQRDQAAKEAQWGDESHGLRCRIVPVSPTMDPENVDLNVSQDRFLSPDEITFAVEIENVSDKPIPIRDIRFGEGYAEKIRHTLNANHFAPHLIDFTFTDAAGKAIVRTQREFVLESHSMILHGALVKQIEPKQSIKCLLQPAKFERSMEYRLAPGDYQVQARYRGPSQAVKDWIATHMQPKEPENSWAHQVKSNFAKFSVSDDGFLEPDLVWGTETDGMQAALEIRVPRDSGIPTQAPGVLPETSLHAVLHVKNVSDKPITFVSEAGRQGDTLEMQTAKGVQVEVKDLFYSGWPIEVRWSLQPGEAAELDVLTPSLNQKLSPGEYSARYAIRFNSRQSVDKEGNQTFPAPGDYGSVLTTGWTPLFLRNPNQAAGALKGKISLDGVVPILPKLRVPTPTSMRLGKRATDEQREKYIASLVEINDESLQVDAERGLANAFVYLLKAPSMQEWKLEHVDEDPSIRIGEIQGYRVLLRRAWKEFTSPRQSAAIGVDQGPSEIRSEDWEFVLILRKAQQAPLELRSQIPWQKSNSPFHTRDVYLGEGMGYDWFARGTIFGQESLRDRLKLLGGEDRIQLLVDGIQVDDTGTNTSNSCVYQIAKFGDLALPYVQKAVESILPSETQTRVVRSLGLITTEASTELLLKYYDSANSHVQRGAQYALLYRPLRKAAKQAYLDMLTRHTSVDSACAACIENKWTEAVPILKQIEAKPESLMELQTVYPVRRILEGNPIPQALLEAAEVIFQARPSDPVDEGSVVGNAVRVLMESSDHEAAILLALKIVNYAPKASFEYTRAVQAQGSAILKARKSAEAVIFLARVLDSLPPREREQVLLHLNPLTSNTPSSLPPPHSPFQPGPMQQAPAAQPVPTGPRKLVATIFGTKVFLDQLQPSQESKAELSKPSRVQAAEKNLDFEGEALLKMISRRAIEDYVRRQRIEISDEMSEKLLEIAKTKELRAHPDSTMSDEKRRAGLLMIMRGSLMDWLICKSLYEKYGGRVGMGSLGLWIAVDGRNELMREYLKKGSIEIKDAELEEAFWKAANKPNFADAYPQGDELKHLMSNPPFFIEPLGGSR